ncbi:MAG: hypothetical protein ACJ8G7_25405, partial [Rhizobacter sp.]
ASWIHLLALTMVLFVIGPRLLLAAFAAARLRLGSARFRLPLAEPYFQRIVGLHRGSEADVAVFPYAHTPKPQAVLGLQGLVAEAFGPRATVRFAPTAAFGAEDDPVALVAAGPPPSHAVALCELGATPEAESHGRYLGRLAAELPPATVFALVVDEAAFRQRFAGMQERLGQRRKAWQSFAESLGGVPAFVDLEIPVDADAVARLHDAFGRSLRPDAANAAGGDGRAGRASPTGPTGRAGWAGRVDRVGPEGPEHPENPTRSVDPPQAR